MPKYVEVADSSYAGLRIGQRFEIVARHFDGYGVRIRGKVVSLFNWVLRRYPDDRGRPTGPVMEFNESMPMKEESDEDLPSFDDVK